MCSNNEDDFGDDGGLHAMQPVIVENHETQEGGVCKKCGQHSELLYKLNFREAECRVCFLAYVRHKFRAALGSSKVLPRDAEVLLVYDGSAEATMLLDMLHYAQTQNTFKRLHCTVKILFIDESSIAAESIVSIQARREQLATIRDFLATYGIFESFVVPLSQKVVSPLSFDAYLKQLTDADETCPLRNRLASLTTLTSRQDFLHQQRKRLIVSVASALNYSYAFLPDISMTLASRLLTSIALGRGGSAALDVALVDERQGIKLVRPVKDINIAEVQLYLRAQQLTALITSSQAYGLAHGTQASLQNLTQAFIENLQQNYTATVSTIFRTGDKIAANSDLTHRLAELTLHKDVPDKCDFCLSQLDNAHSKTLLAIEFSRLTSQAGIALNESVDLDEKARENVLHGKNELWTRLCHGCRNIQTDSITGAIL